MSINIPIIFVSGPFSGPTGNAVEANIEHAEELGLEVAKVGGFPVVPNSLGRIYAAQRRLNVPATMEPGYEWWIEATKAALHRCDALIVVPGWVNSSGARGEVDYALKNQIPVFGVIDELRTWIEDWKKLP